MTTTSSWISLPAATVGDLEAELARRAAEEEQRREEAAKAAEVREAEGRELAKRAPAQVRAWAERIAALSAEQGRPTPDLRSRARGALLRHEWGPFLEHDDVAAELQAIATEAGALLGRLEGYGADEQLLVDVDALECAAFAATWARIHFVAGVES